MIPFTSTVLSLLQFEGSSVSSLNALSGSFYFFGGIAMNIAGIAEFILGNTFPFVAFIIYGTHWVNLAYLSDPSIALVASYNANGVPGALSQAYNAGQGNYNLVMALVSFFFLCGSIRTNVPFVVLFLGLVLLFSFIAAADYQLGYNPSLAGLEHAIHYYRIAGGFGFVSMVLGWYVSRVCYDYRRRLIFIPRYLAFITVCAATGVPCPLPIFDLSQKVFPNSIEGQKAEHAGVVKESNIKA
jgi:succinate-acetate transporter protein